MTTATSVMALMSATTTTTRPLLTPRNTTAAAYSSPPTQASFQTTPNRHFPPTRIRCEVALRSSEQQPSTEDECDEEVKSKMAKVGSRVKVNAPLRVYHVLKLPDLELTPDMTGVIKQYVGFYKGKRISPNYPFKVEFLVDSPTRGPVKFVAHLKEDEFQILQ